MKLNATVTALHSANKYPDDRRRVQINVEGGDAGYRSFIVPNDDLALDDELILLVLTKGDAESLYHWLKGLRGVEIAVVANDIIGQLRPDEPPPFMEQPTGKILDEMIDICRGTSLPTEAQAEREVGA